MKAGWQVKRLADVCEIKPPKSEARKLLAPTDSVSFVPMENLGIDQKYLVASQVRSLDEVAGSYTYFADGDVLLAKITPCFENGKLGIARDLTNGIGFGSSEYIVFRPNETLLNEYLYYFLARETFRQEGAQKMAGAVGHKRVSKEFIENYGIPLPSVLEQQRIVAILDETFDGIATVRASAEKNLHHARALFDSHLQSVFTQKIEGWQMVPLSELASDITDGDHMPPPKSTTGVPFITISNINKETREIDLSDTFIVSREYFKKLKLNRKPQKGDVLYTVTGSFGIPVIVNSNVEFCFQRHIGLVRPTIHTNSKWLYYLLLSPIVLRQANEGATGTAQKTVSLKVLRNILVPKMPLTDQKAIVTALDALSTETQRLTLIYRQKIAALDELKKSLLHQAFSGQL